MEIVNILHVMAVIGYYSVTSYHASTQGYRTKMLQLQLYAPFLYYYMHSFWSFACHLLCFLALEWSEWGHSHLYQWMPLFVQQSCDQIRWPEQHYTLVTLLPLTNKWIAYYSIRWFGVRFYRIISKKGFQPLRILAKMSNFWIFWLISLLMVY